MKRILTYCPTLLVLFAITYLSLWRQPSFSLPLFAGADKVAHFAMYALLSLVFLFDSWRAKQLILPQEGVRGSLFYIYFMLYGGLIELLQEYFFYPRTGTWGDWLADIAGCAVGLIAFLIIWKRAKKN